MPLRLAAALLLVALPAASPAVAAEGGFESALRDFRKLHRSELRQSGIAGSSFCLVKDGRTVAADHLGEQDSEAQVTVDARTVYHWASITKTMTGIAIMQLRDRGLLKLDDPIVRFVPELASVHNRFGDTGAITLRQLMSHSAGFRGGTWPWREHEWQPFDEGKGVRFIGHNGDQNGFRAYLSFCPDQGAGTLLAFNTETRGVRNDPSNRETAESRIALATDRPCGALARPGRG